MLIFKTLRFTGFCKQVVRRRPGGGAGSNAPDLCSTRRANTRPVAHESVTDLSAREGRRRVTTPPRANAAAKVVFTDFAIFRGISANNQSASSTDCSLPQHCRIDEPRICGRRSGSPEILRAILQPFRGQRLFFACPSAGFFFASEVHRRETVPGSCVTMRCEKCRPSSPAKPSRRGFRRRLLGAGFDPSPWRSIGISRRALLGNRSSATQRLNRNAGMLTLPIFSSRGSRSGQIDTAC